ncbi:MAG TPA: hypothetical protein VFK06_18775 [Candidatus Angelobacter sp.]|nr:hypothetical protein [Candidatus Angelobacter sp.]
MTHGHRILSAFLAVLLSSACIASQPARTRPEIWSGYLVDIVCARERAAVEKDFGANHTKSCLQMPFCERGGFALLTDHKEILRFDNEGNRQARVLIMKTSRKANFRTVVHGVRVNDTLSVSNIELLAPGPK